MASAVGGEGAGDRDDGFVGAGQVGDGGRRVDRAADLGEGAPGLGGDGGPVDQMQGGAGIAGGERDILGHAHPFDQAEILMDERDGQAARGGIDGGAADVDLAGIGAMDAGEDLDEGRLTGAVAAEQGMDLAGSHVEIDRIDGARAAEMFDDAGHPNEGLHVFLRSALR